MKKRLLILCLLLAGCSPSVQPNPTPEPVVVEKHLNINEIKDTSQIDQTITEMYIEYIDYVRVQDGKLLFILNDKSHNKNFTTKALFSYDLSNHQVTKVTPLTNSRRVTDFALVEGKGLFNMNFDDYYRLELNDMHIYVGHVSSYNMMPKMYVGDKVYTYLQDGNKATVISMNADGSYQTIQEIDGIIDPNLSNANYALQYFTTTTNMLYLFIDEKAMTYQYPEIITSIIPLENGLLINGKDLYDYKNDKLSTLNTEQLDLVSYAPLSNDAFVYMDQQNVAYFARVNKGTIETTKIISLKDDNEGKCVWGDGKVYVCYSNTHLKDNKIFEVVYE